MFSSFKPVKPPFSYFGETWWDILGANFYRGTAWHDTAYGFNGNDSLYMGGGSDTAYGGNGRDGLSGEAGNDRLYGDAGNDHIYGGDGNDSLFGGDDNDLLIGGKGADFINGGAGVDTVEYRGGHFDPFGLIGVTVNLETGTGSGADAEGDVIVNVENVIGSNYADTIIGDDQDNTLNGGDGDDVLNGGDGDDVLIGGWNFAENANYGDILTGGAGSDTFVFDDERGGFDNSNSSHHNDRDVITDFVKGEDHIDITGMNFNILIFNGLQNDFSTETGGEIIFNWPSIAEYGQATLVRIRDTAGDEVEFYVLGAQSLTLDDFII